MKSLLTIALLFALVLPSHAILDESKKQKKKVAHANAALDDHALLIGFGIGLAVNVVPWTRNHLVMPPIHAAKVVIVAPVHVLQRTIRPLPQDKVVAAQHKAAKARQKADKLERQAVDVRRRAAEKATTP